MATHSSVLAWDGGAWWAAIYRVAHSRTRLKRLSSSSRSRGFPGGLDGRKSACNVEGPGSISESVRSSGEGNGYRHQYSCLETPMDGGA